MCGHELLLSVHMHKHPISHFPPLVPLCVLHRLRAAFPHFTPCLYWAAPPILRAQSRGEELAPVRSEGDWRTRFTKTQWSGSLWSPELPASSDTASCKEGREGCVKKARSEQEWLEWSRWDEEWKGWREKCEREKRLDVPLSADWPSLHTAK